MSDMSEIAKELLEALDENLVDKNTMSYIEFAQYSALFNKEEASRLDEDELKRLGCAWYDRVSIRDKVTVIDPYHEGDDKTLFVLPPVIQRLNEINHIGEQAGRIVDYFADTLARDTRFNGERVTSLELMKKAMDAAQLKSSGEISESVKEYILLRIKIENRDVSLEENLKSDDHTSTSDLVWE